MHSFVNEINIMAMLSKTDEPAQEVEVNWEDQRKINAFSRLTSNIADLETSLEEKLRLRKNLEDAESDLMMLIDDEEMVPFQIGEVYVQVTQEDASERLQKLQTETDAEIDGVKEKVADINEKLTKLKTALYAKFGNSINLEAD
eukprot:CFRG1296T1